MGEFHERYVKFSSAFLILLFVAGLAVGGIASFYIALQQINSLKSKVSNLENQVSNLWGLQNITYQNITIYQNSTAVSQIYERVKDSVVLIRGVTSSGGVEGSGFVYNFSGTMYIVTNYHVVHETTSRTVTFSNGNGYIANVVGTDPYADLAVLSIDAIEYQLKPVDIVSSSTLKVGEPVIAIGNPYGLVGSMTTGVVSALGRSITEEELIGRFSIANIIQTSAPINPGNSGGPLLNYEGKVVGITVAIVKDSQGLGFAIPSSTIIKEIASLIENGTYDGHSFLGIAGKEMDYETAEELGVTVTYGWLVSGVTSGGPSDNKVNVNDIIIAMNGTKIRNGDDLASYLEEHTLPGYTVTLTVLRKSGSNWQEGAISVTLGKRPPPPA